MPIEEGPTQAPLPGHVGADTCAQCHRQQYDAWKGSQHSRAMQVAELFGLAFYSAGANDRQVALAYVTKLQELEPDNRECAELAARLGATRQ